MKKEEKNQKEIIDYLKKNKNPEVTKGQDIIVKDTYFCPTGEFGYEFVVVVDCVGEFNDKTIELAHSESGELLIKEEDKEFLQSIGINKRTLSSAENALRKKKLGPEIGIERANEFYIAHLKIRKKIETSEDEGDKDDLERDKDFLRPFRRKD